MSPPPEAATIGAVTFADCAARKRDMKVFRVNAGIPFREALEHASNLLYYAKVLSLDAALDTDGEKYAFSSHYLGEMGKAILDDVLQAMLPTGPEPQ